MSETKFCTHTKQQENLYFYIFSDCQLEDKNSEQSRTMNSICSYFLQAIHFRHFKLLTIWHITRWGYVSSQGFGNTLPPQAEIISSLSMSGQNF